MEGLHTLISSNLRFDNPADGIQCWEMRKELLANVVNSYSPLLVGTQEGRKTQLHDFSQLLPEHTICTGHRQWIEDRMYPTIFLRPQINATSGDVWLSNTPLVPGSRLPQSSFPRLMTWVRFKIYERSIITVNMHIDHMNSETRLAQIQIAAEELKKLKSTNDSLIIMGDFNDSPNSVVRNKLIQSFPELYDPWLALNKNEETSHHSFTGIHSQGQRIDWILLDQSIKCQDIFLEKTKSDHIWPSDHFPLVCKIKF